MKIIVYTFCCIILISCAQKNKNNILIENNTYEETLVSDKMNIEKKVKETILTIDDSNENVKINIGDVFIVIPDDYHIGYFDGDKYEYNSIHDKKSDNSFHVMVFNKNTDFDGADSSYTSKNIPFLENYINGISDDMSKYFGTYRRNIFNNINVAERLLLCEHEIINIKFERNISFIYNDRVYVFSINIHNVEKLFIDEMRNYFEIKKGFFSNEDPYGWTSERLDEIYQQYINYNELPIPIERLFIKTNKIFNSLSIAN
ncbi:hypothetical protein FACS189476_06740 [Spirochaetia bacterium]|nr:hypothetical protein FACS189476_06740 [Spirochaetia bacterium]